MKHKITGTITVILLLSILATLMPIPVAAQTNPGNNQTISSTGTIVKEAPNFITIDRTKIIGSNNLSVGFALDNHWDLWLKTPEYTQLAKEASFKIISIYDSSNNDGASFQPCIYWNQSTHSGTFNWTNVDALVRSIYSVGAEPLFCLGGTAGSEKVNFPSGMYIDPITRLPSPEDYANYAVAWVQHFKDLGLPVTYYEIFNEIEQLYFRYNVNYNEAELAAFFEVYMVTYNAMHAANDQILVSNDASTYRTFLDYWVTHGGKVDFLAFHKYVSNNVVKSDEMGLTRAETYLFNTDEIYYGVSEARKIMNNDIPILCTEYGWNAGWETGTDPRIQQMVNAVSLALNLRQEVLLNVQYNVYFAWDSSASWQASIGTGLGFGMVNQDNNQPYYPYYVNRIFGQNLSIDDQIIGSTSTSSDLRTLAWIHNGKEFALIINTVDSPITVTFGDFAALGSYTLIDNTFSYTQPRVQTGILSGENQIKVKGYAVILLECTQQSA